MAFDLYICAISHQDDRVVMENMVFKEPIVPICAGGLEIRVMNVEINRCGLQPFEICSRDNINIVGGEDVRAVPALKPISGKPPVTYFQVVDQISNMKAVVE